MSELATSGQPFDLITLSEHIEKTNNIEALGGFAYLAELSKNTPSAANIIAYARIVAEKSMLRQLQETGNALITDALHRMRHHALFLNPLNVGSFHFHRLACCMSDVKSVSPRLWSWRCVNWKRD